jgi:hypothetical protein
MFVELPAERPELLEQGENLDRRMQEEVGMTVRRYLAICFGLFVRFGAWRPEKASEQGWTIDSSYWAKTTVTDSEFHAVAGALSATPAEFLAAFAKQEKEGFAEIDDLRPFALHPLCEVEPGQFLPVDVEALGPRLFGDGIYWRLRPQGGRTEEAQIDQTRYGASVGRILEAYLGEIARSVYPIAEGAAERVFGEIAYGGQAGVDLAIFDGGRTVFVEMGIDRVNTLKTLFQGDVGSYEKDIKTIVLPRVEQLQRKIDDARAGALIFGTHKPDELQIIHPVICFIDGFPLGPTLRERIDQAVATAGLLQAADVARLTILSPDEMEALFGEVETSGHSASSLLADYESDVDTRLWSVRDFLVARRGGLARSELVRTMWKQTTQRLGHELFGEHETPKTAPE